MTDRGNPGVKVRLEPDLVEETNRAFPAVKGRSGGVSLAIRRLLYLALDKPMPRQFGEIGRAHDIDKLEATIREMEAEAGPPDPDHLQWATDRARALLATAEDAVDVLRLRSALARVSLLENPLPKKS